jgi:predicted CopG family antitoxin
VDNKFAPFADDMCARYGRRDGLEVAMFMYFFRMSEAEAIKAIENAKDALRLKRILEDES